MFFLDSNRMVYLGCFFISLRNVYVSRHDSDGVLTVKLGDSGIPDYSDPAEIYFIPIEMFSDRNHNKCTMKGNQYWYLKNFPL